MYSYLLRGNSAYSTKNSIGYIASVAYGADRTWHESGMIGYSLFLVAEAFSFCDAKCCANDDQSQNYNQCWGSYI